ncbi:MAG: cysteine desulfurase [Chlamydiales bacterium]
MLESKTIRAQFPMLEKTIMGHPLIYFDSAATALKPHCVIDTLTDFYGNHYGTVHRAVYSLAAEATRLYDQARTTVQKFIQAPSKENIVFTKGTTESINLVASSFGKAFIQPGDEILITEVEHHANIVPWQIMCQERKAILKTIPITYEGNCDLSQFASLLSPKTKIVALPHISNTLGSIFPIKEIIHLSHQQGAKVLIDGAQSAARIPINVQDLDADFYVFSGHKCYGPNGIGILYGKEELLEALPPYQGGGDMIATVTTEKTTYNHPPLKFEAGTPPIAEAIALGAALRFLQETGMESIAQHEQDLLHYATSRLKEFEGLRILGESPHKAGVICFTVQDSHPLDIATLLDFKGICIRSGHQCSQPTMNKYGLTASCRISFGIYNTKEEIDLFCQALSNTLPVSTNQKKFLD